MKNNVKLKISPRLMLAFSMAVFGTLGIFTRNINVSSGELALYRAVLAALLIIIYFAATGQRPGLRDTKREIPLLILSGFAMGINWILLFEAYKYTTVSKATLSYYFAPVIVTAVSPFLFRERMTAKKLLCFVMSSIGLVMIIGTGEGAGGSDLKGIFFGLGAAFFYAADSSRLAYIIIYGEPVCLLILLLFLPRLLGVFGTWLSVPLSQAVLAVVAVLLVLLYDRKAKKREAAAVLPSSE